MIDDERPTTRQACPSDETIATWLDGRLTDAERDALEAHIASCPTCAELVAALAPALDGETPSVPEPRSTTAPALAALVPDRGSDSVPRPPAGSDHAAATSARSWRSRAALAMAATLVLALGGAALWTMQDGDPDADLRRLSAAQGALRHTHGRLYAFAYAPPPRTFRSGADRPQGDNVALLEVAADIEQKYQSSNEPDDQHALGVALLVAGDLDGAIAGLDAAAAARPHEVRFVNDAAVAHLERAWTRSDAASLERARRLAEAVVAQAPGAPEGWFNLQMIARLQGDGRREGAAADALRNLRVPADGWLAETHKEVPPSTR